MRTLYRYFFEPDYVFFKFLTGEKKGKKGFGRVEKRKGVLGFVKDNSFTPFTDNIKIGWVTCDKRKYLN